MVNGNINHKSLSLSLLSLQRDDRIALTTKSVSEGHDGLLVDVSACRVGEDHGQMGSPVPPLLIHHTL